MESLFERHDEYVNTISMDYVRVMMNRIVFFVNQLSNAEHLVEYGGLNYVW